MEAPLGTGAEACPWGTVQQGPQEKTREGDRSGGEHDQGERNKTAKTSTKRQRGSMQKRKQRSQTVEIEHRIEGEQQVRGGDKAGGRKEYKEREYSRLQARDRDRERKRERQRETCHAGQDPT